MNIYFKNSTSLMRRNPLKPNSTLPTNFPLFHHITFFDKKCIIRNIIFARPFSMESKGEHIEGKVKWVALNFEVTQWTILPILLVPWWVSRFDPSLYSPLIPLKKMLMPPSSFLSFLFLFLFPLYENSY